MSLNERKEKEKKPVPSLHDIEKALCTLWMDREAREWLLANPSRRKKPDSVASIAPEILEAIEPKGAQLYARSINYEHQDMADCIFPYCAKAIGSSWDDVVSDYYREFPSSHFNFNKICRDFSQYLGKRRQDLMEKYPYISELADYEWLELEKAEDGNNIVRAHYVQINSIEQVTQFFPVVNTTLSVRHYEYPVTEIASNFENNKRPRKKFQRKACRLAIYRDPETHQTRFMELGEATCAIIEQAQKQPTLYQDLLKLGLSLTPSLNPESAAIEFLELVDELHSDNIFIGSLKKGDVNG